MLPSDCSLFTNFPFQKSNKIIKKNPSTYLLAHIRRNFGQPLFSFLKTKSKFVRISSSQLRSVWLLRNKRKKTERIRYRESWLFYSVSFWIIIWWTWGFRVVFLLSSLGNQTGVRVYVLAVECFLFETEYWWTMCSCSVGCYCDFLMLLFYVSLFWKWYQPCFVEIESRYFVLFLVLVEEKFNWIFVWLVRKTR